MSHNAGMLRRPRHNEQLYVRFLTQHQRFSGVTFCAEGDECDKMLHQNVNF